MKSLAHLLSGVIGLCISLALLTTTHTVIGLILSLIGGVWFGLYTIASFTEWFDQVIEREKQAVRDETPGSHQFHD